MGEKKFHTIHPLPVLAKDHVDAGCTWYTRAKADGAVVNAVAQGGYLEGRRCASTSLGAFRISCYSKPRKRCVRELAYWKRLSRHRAKIVHKKEAARWFQRASWRACSSSTCAVLNIL